MRCSVIIPAYNAKDTINVCLESVLNQSLPKAEYEIIVVDDGSTDDTSLIAARYPVRLFQQANQGPAVARNKGVNEAYGDILVFTDSDCELDFGFLKAIISPIEQHEEVIGVQGSYKTKQEGFVARFVQVEIETRYERMALEEYIDFIGTYAAAYRKDMFMKYGGFDPGFPFAVGEDADFSYRLHQKGHKMVFFPQAFVYHKHPASLSHYLKTKYSRGYWRMRLARKHPKKAIKDSYVLPSVKLQIVSIPLLIVLGFLSVYNLLWLAVFLLVLGSFVLFSIPFVRLFGEGRLLIITAVPCMLFLRGVVILCGMCFGMVNELVRR